MKKILFFLAAVLLVCSVLQADIMAPGVIKPTREIQQAGRAIPPTRNAPEFTFTVDPYSIIVNYYDYMIGSYSSLPLRVIPAVGGGGYFMVYHGRRQANSQRRVFYTYLDESGNVISNNEITNVQNHEGFPTMIVDPVSGKPFYAWHANVDDDADLEVEFVSDAFLGGFSGLWNDIQLIADIMVHSGIKAIWNFTPQKIIVPPDIIVEYVDMFASLAVLSRRLAERD